MSFQSQPTFQMGDEVEVYCNSEGFLGSYWEATIIANMGTRYLVEYKHFVEEHDESKPLRETVRDTKVRPVPPKIVPSRYTRLIGHWVDAYINDVWWKGTISRRIDSKNCVVFFESNGEEVDCQLSQLRFHMNWHNGQWFPSKKRTAPVSSKRFAPYSCNGRREQQLVAL